MREAKGQRTHDGLTKIPTPVVVAEPDHPASATPDFASQRIERWIAPAGLHENFGNRQPEIAPFGRRGGVHPENLAFQHSFHAFDGHVRTRTDDDAVFAQLLHGFADQARRILRQPVP